MLFVSNRLYNKTLNTSPLKVKVDATASYLPIDIDAPDADANGEYYLCFFAKDRKNFWVR